MSRTETYPWSRLKYPGDYFIVMADFKPYTYVAAMVAQHNYKDKNRRYVASKCDEGTIVLLAWEMGVPTLFDDMFTPGVMIKLYSHDETVKPQTTAFIQGQMETRHLTQEQKINLMTREDKLINLPWWWEDGRPILGKKMDREDVTKYVVQKQKIPGPNVPYPDKYNLDENLRIKSTQPEFMTQDDEEEEPWADDEDPIIGNGDGHADT